MEILTQTIRNIFGTFGYTGLACSPGILIMLNYRSSRMQNTNFFTNIS